MQVLATQSRFVTALGNYGCFYLAFVYGDVLVEAAWFEAVTTQDSGSAISVFNNYATVHIQNSVFTGLVNLRGDGQLHFLQTLGALSLTNLTFADSLAVQGGAIFLQACFANVLLSDSKFRNLSAQNGGALYLYQIHGVFTLQNCEFSDLSAQYGGVLYAQDSTDAASTLQLDSVRVQKLTVAYEGSFVYAQSANRISLVAIDSRNTSESLVYLLGVQSASLQGVRLTDHTGNFLFAQIAQSISLTNLTLSRASSPKQHVISVSGVQYLEVAQLELLACVFESNFLLSLQSVDSALLTQIRLQKTRGMVLQARDSWTPGTQYEITNFTVDDNQNQEASLLSI